MVCKMGGSERSFFYCNRLVSRIGWRMSEGIGRSNPAEKAASWDTGTGGVISETDTI